jgi:hypothetical protein
MKPSFLSEPVRGFTLIPAVGTTTVVPGAFRHQFCGKHDIRGAQCPNCHKPLLLILGVNAHDPRVGLDSSWNCLPLVYCWTCERDEDVFSYQLLDDHEIEIISDFAGEPLEEFPYTDYPESFEEVSVILTELALEDQLAIQALNRGTDDLPFFRLRPWLCDPVHQIGGEPLLMQGIHDFAPRCPACSNQMPHFASIGNSNMSPKGFVGSAGVQILFNVCRRCAIVSAVNRTD